MEMAVKKSPKNDILCAMEKTRRIKKVRKNHSIEGTIQITPRGVGFFSSEQLKNDARIETRFLRTALHGDTVKVLLYHAADEKRVEVVKIVKRAKTDYVGTLEKKHDGLFYVRPQDPRMYVDIIIPKNLTKGAKSGQKVLARITKWKDSRKLPEGEILEIIGKAGEHETEMIAILLDKGISSKFPAEVEKETTDIQKKRESILAKALLEREDYRNVPTFTIDPDDAKDFDDALSYRTLAGGDIEIGVHIADVSHYVKYVSAIDIIW
jgi:VacB/RNase II family 3'-5' exoribonuclease